MSNGTRDVFILGIVILIYGAALLIVERAAVTEWGENFAHDPKAVFGREHDRDRMIEQEMTAPTFIPADDGANHAAD